MFFTPFCTLATRGPPCKILRRSSQGNPHVDFAGTDDNFRESHYHPSYTMNLRKCNMTSSSDLSDSCNIRFDAIKCHSWRPLSADNRDEVDTNAFRKKLKNDPFHTSTCCLQTEQNTKSFSEHSYFTCL